MPDSFAKRWQVVGEQGRQIWVSKYYMRVFGPIDDVFGKLERRTVKMQLFDQLILQKTHFLCLSHKVRQLVDEG